jgi:hypothetical protein
MLFKMMIMTQKFKMKSMKFIKNKFLIVFIILVVIASSCKKKSDGVISPEDRIAFDSAKLAAFC